MSSRVKISTSIFSKAYLAVAWKSRNELTDYERRGFAQFFYLTICGHIESLLSSIIKVRINSIRYMVRWEAVPPMQFNDGGQIHHCELKPVIDSVLQIVSLVAKDTENAPLNKLFELYSKVFSQSLKEITGKDLYEDLDALASLRNLFAHGRDLFIEFDGPFPDKATLDNNPLQKPAQRLFKAGIIKDFNITGRNYDKFQALFYSDEVLLYFYRSVQKIEDVLIKSIGFMPEKSMTYMPPLVDLEVEE
ncbi:hypothetical protein H6F52_16405 [Coleofasciculus sp. FACHB-542]|nr:hypothetical protein [Coleofasciculus sp. FACHB-542]